MQWWGYIDSIKVEVSDQRRFPLYILIQLFSIYSSADFAE